MPHICAIPLDSSVLQALRQARGHIGPQREDRGLERPRERRVAPERLPRKRRQACKQHHDEHDDQPSYQAEDRPQRAIRRSQTGCADGRRKREPDDPADHQYHAKHDQEAYSAASSGPRLCGRKPATWPPKSVANMNPPTHTASETISRARPGSRLIAIDTTRTISTPKSNQVIAVPPARLRGRAI